MSYDLSIIIVNWNGSSLLKCCVESIVSSAPQVTYEIVVIDNASEDDSLEQLSASEVAAPMFAEGQLSESSTIPKTGVLARPIIKRLHSQIRLSSFF